MVTWLSLGYVDSTRIDMGCLRVRSALPASHDQLSHSLLGIMDVVTDT